MFTYDHGMLADVAWSEYIAVKKENLDLRCQLETAKQTVEALRTQIDSLASMVEALQADADESADWDAESKLER
jgi:hypothetical protein